ncbi:MAG: hypothetical protein IKO91_08865 [Oscillospiraceae bacterium]|nr:hypothetical protein [Oscillospiraceae bacterium]
MEIDPGSQGLQALLSLFCGMALGLLYEILVCLLRALRLERWLVLFYIPFSLLAAVLLFLLGSIAGRGQLRLFMLLGMLLGGFLYLTALRPPGRWLAQKIGAAVSFLLRLFLIPLRFLRSMLKKTCEMIKKLFHSAKKWYKIHFGFLDSAFGRTSAEAKHEASKIGILYRYGPDTLDPAHLRGGVAGEDERAHRKRGSGPGCSGRPGPKSGRGQRLAGIRDRALR